MEEKTVKSFISTFILSILIIFFSIKIFAEDTPLSNLYLPPKLGIVICIFLLLMFLGASIKAYFIVDGIMLMFAGLLLSFGQYEISSNLVVITYLFLILSILYDIFRLYTKKQI